jgi:hypothetical protein
MNYGAALITLILSGAWAAPAFADPAFNEIARAR